MSKHHSTYMYNPLPNDNFFRLVLIECIFRQHNSHDSKIENCVGKSRKHCRKRRKCWLPAFSPFPKAVQRASSTRVDESLDYVVKD